LVLLLVLGAITAIPHLRLLLLVELLVFLRAGRQ
jgi:hypothetical protein